MERGLNELEKKYDTQFKVVFDAIRQLMAVLPSSRKKIGFQLRERRATFGGKSAGARRAPPRRGYQNGQYS
jgi:hypothetical protein